VRVELREKFINSGTFMRVARISRSVQTPSTIYGRIFQETRSRDIFASFLFYFDN